MTLMPVMIAAIAAKCAVSAPNDSVRVAFRYPDAAIAPAICIDTAKAKPFTVRSRVTDFGWPKVIAKHQTIQLGLPKGQVNFNLFPDPALWGGVLPGPFLSQCLKTIPPPFERQFRFEARYRPANDAVELYFENQYIGMIERSGAVREVHVDVGDWKPRAKLDVQVDDLELDDGRALTFDLKPFKADADPRFQVLGSRGKMHASDRLVKGDAKLSLQLGRQMVECVPMDVLPVAESLDSGRHQRTSFARSLFVDPYYDRTAFNSTPQYMQWSVPSDFYAYAWVLCAELPGKGLEPALGMQVSRLANRGDRGFALSSTDVRKEGRAVGQLSWTEDGKRLTADLKLVRHFLNLGTITDIVNDRPVYGNIKDPDGPRVRRKSAADPVGSYLDVELAGCGAYSGMGGCPRSGVQVFGITLERAPYAIEFVQSEKGNIFANDEKPETGVRLTPLGDDVRGSLEYTIGSDDFRTLAKRTVPFTLSKAGKGELLKVDLDMKTNGWYSLEFLFRDAKGEPLFWHGASFALLGKDTREAGAESPYSGWAHVRESGRHWNDPDRERVAKLMWKEGVRNSWEPPNDTEDEFPEYPIVMSQYQGAKNPPVDKKGNLVLDTDEKMAKYIDGKIEEFRQLRQRYPHLKTWLVLHEHGGRDLAEELLFLPAKKGAYTNRRPDAQYAVKYCTEVCKRVKAAFPDVELQLGNGSSSSQRVAWMIRDGFELDLVDKLGIESKGFNLMPELPTQRESPGMAWALWATGKRYGYDKRLSACNEYIFNPERGVNGRNRMTATETTIRSYLISLLWQFDNISVGHMEDSGSNYYNTNWGAGGHCTAYPYSYPKRLYVALATFTKVFDKAVAPRRIETDGPSTYAWEFTRERKTRDYASAYWTPLYDVTAKVVFPTGAKVTRVDWQGREAPLPLDKDNSVGVSFGSTPTYLVSSAPAVRLADIVHSQSDADAAKALILKRITLADVEPVNGDARLGDLRKVNPSAPSCNGSQPPIPGEFAFKTANDAAHGEVLDAMLVKNDEYVPEVCGQYQYVKFREPYVVPKKMRAALWVDGNGSFAKMHLEIEDPKGGRSPRALGFQGLIVFDGWHLMPCELEKGEKVTGLWIGSARTALDPKTMVDVTKSVRVGPLVRLSSFMSQKIATERDSMEFVDDKDL